MAGLVAVLAFAATTWFFAAVVGPFWGVRDVGARVTLGVGAGAAVAALAALWGKSFVDGEDRRGGSRQSVVDSSVGGGVTRVTGAGGNVKVTIGSGPAASPLPQPGAAPEAPPATGGQFVRRSRVNGSVVDVDGAAGDVEIEA
ncbi:hypothetical protein [Kitasatospora sp. NPDC001527]|uniref:hypothetical protein n=1 Tax=Kitasatospora sp. NPDC001527 TaxID=3154519 RepID=UPI003333BA2B